jgi:hypothetical protein
MSQDCHDFAGIYKVVGVYQMFKENEELMRSESESNLTKRESPPPSSFLGNTGQFAQSDGTEIDRQDENSEIIAARVKRARVVYRPVIKKSKVTAAKLEKCFAAEIGGKVCEWNVPFDICCRKNFIDIISLMRKK